MLECAIAYADLGWPVLPLWSVDKQGRCLCGKSNCSSPGKHPHGRYAVNGAKSATKDGSIIVSWFTNGEDLNIGICAGEDSGLLILDVDPKHGGSDSLAKYNSLPQTPQVETGSGGRHYYFRHPGGDVRNSAGTLGPGLDVRGHHGYVVAPPSLHQTGKEYKWLIDPKAPLADMPRWLINDQRKKSDPSLVQGGKIPAGKRNSWLTSQAGGMRCRGANYAAIYRSLRELNAVQCDPPLSDAEVNRIARSVSDYAPEKCRPGTKLNLKAMSGIEPKSIEWFWPDKIPTSALSMLIGDVGSAKTYLSMYLAALVSTGGDWPDGQRVKRGTVIILNDEDTGFILRERLAYHSADMSKIYLVDSVSVGDDKDYFDLTRHVEALNDTLSSVPDCRLIVVDPITAYLGNINANSNAEVRAALSPLAVLAATYSVTVLIINHLNKKADLAHIYRGLGSTAFMAQARSVWGVLIDKDDRETRILCPVKTNYSINPTGLKFRIIDGAVRFEPEPWQGHIDDMNDKGATKSIDLAADWLKEVLSNGNRLSDTLIDEGREYGYGRNLLFRAKKKLGVRASRDGYGGKWFWSLPDV
jgi:hypothetical protein